MQPTASRLLTIKNLPFALIIVLWLVLSILTVAIWVSSGSDVWIIGATVFSILGVILFARITTVVCRGDQPEGIGIRRFFRANPQFGETYWVILYGWILMWAIRDPNGTAHWAIWGCLILVFVVASVRLIVLWSRRWKRINSRVS